VLNERTVFSKLAAGQSSGRGEKGEQSDLYRLNTKEERRGRLLKKDLARMKKPGRSKTQAHNSSTFVPEKGERK